MRILISPFAKAVNGKLSPKNYPWWPMLVKMLEKDKHELIQIGVYGEPKLTQNCVFNCPYDGIESLLRTCDTAISVDSFLPHLAHKIGKSIIVIWGPSSLIHYGYNTHINIPPLNQTNAPHPFIRWDCVEPKPDLFVPPQIIMQLIKNYNYLNFINEKSKAIKNGGNENIQIINENKDKHEFKPAEIILYTQSYPEKNQYRLKEYENCLIKNNENKFINNICVLAEQGSPKYDLDKITYINIDKRPTYQDFFNLMNSRSPDAINVLSNSDIWFDETIELSQKISEDECFALLRWERETGKIAAGIESTEKTLTKSVKQRNYDPKMLEQPIYPDGICHKEEPGSQDVWIFRGRVKPVKADFCLGIPGCDNVIANNLQEAGYSIVNPAMSIRSWHEHASKVRNYLGNGDFVNGKSLFVYAQELR